MSVGILDPAAMFDRVLEYATKNLRIERLLIQAGLDPNNVTYNAIFDRLLDLALVNITFANVFALVGGIFLIFSFVVRTVVPMRVLCIFSIVFFLVSAVLAGSVPHFFLYLLALPINVVRLVQIRNLVRKARSSAQGTLSLGWLRPFMTSRHYKKGDVLFRKGDPATEMFLTVSGKFLVTEIKIEIPPERILGELGFVSPNNHRTQSVECIEDGEVLTILYDKLLEIYFQNPEFGYYFLRLTSDRLLQNFARLEGSVEQSKAALEAATGATKASAATGGNVIDMVLRRKQRRAARASLSSSAAEIAALRRMEALAVVDRYANYSAASGFIPLPIVNMAAITAVLVRMVKALSDLYGEPFEDNRAYSLVIGLMGGVMPTRLATVATSTVLHFVPGYNLFGLAVSSVTAAAYARKIGRILIDQFERNAELQRRRADLQRSRRWQDIWPIRWASGDAESYRAAWSDRIRSVWPGRRLDF
ncbi:MAG: hypothetical protein QOF09_2999 [Alphaproteobacteria bacterium]|jgi:uncharacterized protein (DUF697 family)|nr:hypothetical protein [Alphaproteobacteria bacterium]